MECRVWEYGVWDMGHSIWDTECGMQDWAGLGCPCVTPELLTQTHPSPNDPNKAKVAPTGMGWCHLPVTPGTAPWHGKPSPRDALAAASRNSCSTLRPFIALLHVIEKAKAGNQTRPKY